MGETENHHVHDFAIFERVPDSRTQLFIFANTRTPQTIQETPKWCSGILFLKYREFGSRTFWKVRNGEAETNWRSYLPKNMTCHTGNMKSLKRALWSQETLKPRNQDTKQTRNQKTTEIKKPKRDKPETKKPRHQEPPYPSTYRLPPLHPTTFLGDTRELGGI